MHLNKGSKSAQNLRIPQVNYVLINEYWDYVMEIL